MDIVINSSPLILLGGIDRLSLLNKLFSKVYIPHAVLDEVKGLDLSHIEYSSLQISNKQLVAGMLGSLNRGEVEVIVGAVESGVQYVVLDDNAARNKAKQFGLNVTGTLGILLCAKNANLVSGLEQEIAKLRVNGMYLTDELVRKVLSL
jgi:predicted nucleic acid-binding protein